MMSELKLNIGAGISYIPGFKNIDISNQAEITLDLNRDELPFENDSVDLIFSYHTMEHVQNYIFALGEIHRVLKHGARLLLGVPYVTSTRNHLVNPYHVQNFSERSFDFFDPRLIKGGAAEENSILFKKIYHRYHYMGIFNLTPPPLRDWTREHLMNVVKKIDFGLIAIKKPNDLAVANKFSAQKMKKEFATCIEARIPYDSEQHHGVVSTNRQQLRKLGLWWRGQSF